MTRAPYLLPAGMLALGAAGCGHHKVTRSHKPVKLPARSAPAKAASGASGSFTGSDVPTQFGDVQVALTLSHGRIANVQWLHLPFDRPRSQEISQQAAPLLRQEVLAAQSARIDLLSGATYTSEAWAASVQSALQRAGR